ncbi:MAG TPA: hypothetical protein PKZ83_16755 [bacterium]|nr:hypothetical protein [bacterium]HQJ66344.1 hypothetical protein [bacterium]
MQEENELWQRATSQKTIKGIERYLKNHPGSVHEAHARAILDSLCYSEAEKNNSLESIDAYLHRFPQGMWAAEALNRKSELVWDGIQKSNTIEAYQHFIDQYSQSPKTSAAKAKIEELHFLAIKDSAVSAPFERYLEQFPNSQQHAEARAALVHIYAQELAAKKSYKEKEAIEDRIIRNIVKYGVGKRFVLSDLTPDSDSQSGSIAIEESERNPGSYWGKMLYPKDQLSFSAGMGLSANYPFGDRGIWRFMGSIKFREGYVFIGSRTDALTFMFLKKAGFVYLHGKGKVMKNNRLVASFI